jgi:RpiR family carbohydrate utilization transcriptional regulator
MMLDRIRACMTALPPAEQRVARLVLADARSFASLPVAELAKLARVSKPTVVRFCRSLGYDGLADFKRKLSGSVAEGVPFARRPVDDGDGIADVVVKVVDNAVGALLNYRNAAASHAIERAVELLAAAAQAGTRIEFYGVGNSAIVAQDAQYKFFRLGVNCTAISDGHVQVMSAALLEPADVAVIISNSGRSHDPLEVCELAARKAAGVIVISASGSPLALQAQGPKRIVLAADHAERLDRYSPMGSRLLHLLIIDILSTGVALRLGSGELRPLPQQIKKNLRAKRHAASA